MGAYSSKPTTETITEQGSNSTLSYAASSMQGWRLTQEDAHVALLDFDDTTVKSHFFAVFDGHGGAEVAQFAAQSLPTWVKKLPAFSEGNIEKALIEAFLTFDKYLTENEAIEQLKILAGDTKEDEEDNDEELNEAIMLREEADMPIEKLMEKYGKPTAAATTSCTEAKETKKSEEPVAGGSGMPSSSSKTSSATHQSLTTETPVQNGSESGSSQNGESHTSTQENGAGNHVVAEKDEIAVKEPIEKETTVAEEVKNGMDGEVPKKEGKGKQKKVIIPKPKRKIEPVTAYQQFLADCDDESSDEDEEDNAFGPAFGQDSDSDDGEEGVDKTGEEEEEDDDDDEEDEEEDDSSSSDDEDGNPAMLMGFTPTGDFEEPGKDSGCTAVVAIVKGDRLYVANAGDSRCVVSCDGKAVEMSEDHKPEDEKELARIQKAGGKVTCDGRVNGGLNLSRALGDHTYKASADLPLEQQMISPEPDVRQLQLTPEHEFMILACDGIWNSMSSQEAVDFVRERLNNKTSPAKICEELFRHCLSPDTSGDGTGCDNMTAIIVTFDENKQTVKRKMEGIEKSDTKDEPVSKKAKDEEKEEEEAKSTVS